MDDQLFASGTLVLVISAIVASIVVFLICREIVCWYWKINRIVGLLEEISAKLSKKSDEAQQHYERASAYEERKQFDEALKSCDIAIRIAPGYADAHNLRGIVLEELGRKEEAASAYREAVRLDPTFGEAAENLRDLETEPMSAAAE